MAAPTSSDPVAVLVWRGERIESRHRVAHAVVDRSGRLLASGGDVQRSVYPRSAIKPLQALALVTSGAADRFAVSGQELALACASHGGEPFHVRLVRAWLKRLRLDESALACGTHPPLHGPSAARLVRRGASPSPLHNNCSGKHLGMLTLALHIGAPTAGYARPEHPVQRRIAALLVEMTGLDDLPGPATDGCSVPTWPLPLAALATAFARFANPTGLPPEIRAACERVRAAMLAHPELVAGTGRPCTAIMRAAPEILVKTGAEGVYAAALPEQGIGIALKVEDGAGRASPVALLALLDWLGALDENAHLALTHIARPALRNHAGLEVGRIEPAPEWPTKA